MHGAGNVDVADSSGSRSASSTRRSNSQLVEEQHAVMIGPTKLLLCNCFMQNSAVVISGPYADVSGVESKSFKRRVAGRWEQRAKS